mmetsp:Transcript_39539/g.61653  ORF Transcript_39539/g.61653 Transcript_39539/m.61653 type:complete len:596 (+) Transcript_39539:184-1971(+)
MGKGDLRMFKMAAIQCLEDLQAAGLLLRFVFDGMIEPSKQETALKRGKENARKIDSTMRKVRASSGEAVQPTGFVLPPGCFETMIEVLLELGIPCRRALYEADGELAVELVKHEGIAVLSNDSDMMCMRIPMMTLNELRISSDGVSGVIYEPDKVAGAMKMPRQALPMLSCLVGNDYIEKDLMSPLHQKLVGQAQCTRSKSVILGIAKMLGEYKSWREDGSLCPEEDLQLMETVSTALCAGNLHGKSDQKQFVELVHRCRQLYSLHHTREVDKEERITCHPMEAAHIAMAEGPECLHIAKHRQIWCRLAIEHHHAADFQQTAHRRTTDLRRRLFTLILGNLGPSELDADEVCEFWQSGAEFRKVRITELPRLTRTLHVTSEIPEIQKRGVFLEAVGLEDTDFAVDVVAEDALMVCCLRHLAESQPRATFVHAHWSALIATLTCPAAAFAQWVEQLQPEEDFRRDVRIINLFQTYMVVLFHMNAFNDVLQRPFPPLSPALVSPQLLHYLVRAYRGVAAGIEALPGVDDGCRCRWKERYNRVLASASYHLPSNCFLPSQRTKKRDKPEGSQKDSSQRVDKPKAKSSGNMFEMLCGED